MRRFLSLMAFALVGPLASSPAVAADETQEPRLVFRVEIAGQTHRVPEGDPLPLQGTFTDPTLKITAEPFREFTYGGMSFRYPAQFTFEAEVGEEDAKNWTLSGNDCKIMAFDLAEKLSAAAYAAAIVEQFGAENCTVSEFKCDLPGAGEQGTRIKVHVVGHAMTMDVIELPTEKGSRLLVLQDSPTAAGARSKEAQATLKELKATFQLRE